MVILWAFLLSGAGEKRVFRGVRKEFKKEALKLSDEIGVKKAASQLGLQYDTLPEWRKNRKAATRLPDAATDAEQKAHIWGVTLIRAQTNSETGFIHWKRLPHCFGSAIMPKFGESFLPRCTDIFLANKACSRSRKIVVGGRCKTIGTTAKAGEPHRFA